MIVVLFIIGLAMISFLHLIIPIIVIKKTPIITEKKTVWLWALAGGLLGFIVCAIMVEQFRGLAGIVQSAFWVVVDYFIIKKKCYV